MNTLGVKKWCICFLCISLGVAALIFNGVFARVNISVSGGSSGDGLNEVANKTLGHSIYTGTVNKVGEPHGKGVQMYSWGEVHEGKWRKDVYEGDFRNGVKHGKGTYTFGDGRKYVGDYKDGKEDGQGTITLPNGDKYVGDFVEGNSCGKGVFTWANGDKYVGDFVDDKRHGNGTYTSSNGWWSNGGYQAWTHGLYDLKYEGEFANDKKHGRGISLNVNGNTYVGDWVDDKRHGKGIATYYASGRKYVGDFRADKYHGKGTYTWGGRKYVGDYKDGNKHGKGAYTWSDGEKYVGDFECGEMHGQGIRTKADGTAIHSGAWVKNKPAESLPETLGQCEDYFKRRRESQGFNSKALEVGGMTSWSYKDPFY